SRWYQADSTETTDWRRWPRRTLAMATDYAGGWPAVPADPARGPANWLRLLDCARLLRLAQPADWDDTALAVARRSSASRTKSREPAPKSEPLASLPSNSCAG